MKWQIIGTFAIVVGITLWSLAPSIEGRLFPVVDETRFTIIEDAEDPGWSRAWGESRRVRECNFVGAEFRLVVGSRFTIVDHVFEETAKVRDDGWFDFGPWRVHLTGEQLRERSKSFVTHRCHPFWLTRTPFHDTTGTSDTAE